MIEDLIFYGRPRPLSKLKEGDYFFFRDSDLGAYGLCQVRYFHEGKVDVTDPMDALLEVDSSVVVTPVLFTEL